MNDNYPKYIIPCTPICAALLLGVLLPQCIKLFRHYALPGGLAVNVGVSGFSFLTGFRAASSEYPFISVVLC